MAISDTCRSGCYDVAPAQTTEACYTVSARCFKYLAGVESESESWGVGFHDYINTELGLLAL